MFSTSSFSELSTATDRSVFGKSPKTDELSVFSEQLTHLSQESIKSFGLQVWVNVQVSFSGSRNLLILGAGTVTFWL